MSGQQSPRFTRILGGNQVNFTQDTQSTQGNILQVTYWCRHDIKGGHCLLSSSFWLL